MKVIMINGSPRKNGVTATVLNNLVLFSGGRLCDKILIRAPFNDIRSVNDQMGAKAVKAAGLSYSTFRRWIRHAGWFTLCTRNVQEVSETNQYVTGAVIKELREKNKMTQLEFADKLGVSDKTVSKWETGKGYPDITLLEPIADVFSISVTELISGITVVNSNVSANMMRSKFYVCPVCGNAIHSMGETVIQCHGLQLMPLEAEPSDEGHMVFIERVEDEYYVRIDHSMTKQHFISFAAAVSSDNIQMVKLYPEGSAEARFKIRGVRRIYFYCNRDGLFYIDVVKGIDDKESSYDNTQERRELEQAADMLFGRN